MNKPLLLVAVCILTAVASVTGQDLQFGQVKLLTFQANTSPYTSPVYTVPTNKVWKIEGGACLGSVDIYEVNGLRVNLQLSSNGTFPGAVPLWFPAGTTLKFYNDGSTGSSFGCFISLIEFDVTP
ncbi:MAG: hypothetical protein SFW35_05635 [Chitinophagales bacterium]|nr:hypothetical protein [Chitinophagales bacterium]